MNGPQSSSASSSAAAATGQQRQQQNNSATDNTDCQEEEEEEETCQTPNKHYKMHSTLIRLGRGNVSTHHGQIKILKNGALGGAGDLLSYIRKSVKAGTYRTQSEIDEMNKSLQDTPMELRRIRWNTTRGSKIQDYPIEYQILSLNPPAPFTPKMPLRTLRKQYSEYQRHHRPTDRLARQYLHKIQQQEQFAGGPGGKYGSVNNGMENKAPVSAEEYYSRLLGGSGAAGAGGKGRRLSQAQMALQQKSSAVQKSYIVAMKQYQLMQTDNGTAAAGQQKMMTEQEALAEVERLLAEESVKEQTSSRTRAESLRKEIITQQQQQTHDNTRNNNHETTNIVERGQKAFPDADPYAKKNIIRSKQQRGNTSRSNTAASANTGDDVDDTPLSMLYGNDQRGFEGYVIWTKRLQAVPYKQWTVGASTALDHWIAKRVLGLSEETWLALLEGNSPELLGRGRDIVMARQALFPETVLDGPSLGNVASASADDDDTIGDGGLLSSASSDELDDMDELLANLAAWNKTSPDASATAGVAVKKHEHDILKSSSSSDAGKETSQLVAELNEWRTEHAETPYDKWSDERKQSLMLWVEDFVSSVVADSSALAAVDLETTRRNLLSVPPQTKDEVDSFWEKIRDEASAEILLQKLLDDRASSTTSAKDEHPFWQLDYQTQLQRLVNLGTIGELANEYSSEAERSKFLTRYGDYLCEGLDLDYLVPDPNGPILASKDLGQTLIKAYKIEPDQRFRLQKMKHGEQGDDVVVGSMTMEAAHRARNLYKAWNTLKVGRANYEEKMFTHGKLGLTYNEDPKDHTEES